MERNRLRVAASNQAGSASAASVTVPSRSSDSPPRNTSLPGVSGGNASVGTTLRAGGTGAWTGTAPIVLGYRWQRCRTPAATSCTGIPAATERLYTLTPADRGSLHPTS